MSVLIMPVVNEKIDDLVRLTKTDIGAINEAFHKVLTEYMSRCRSDCVQGRGAVFNIVMTIERPADQVKPS